ncbi:hypothetical protein NW759_010128 [Fusarium solani]|jgi:hypothetical protein|nr:hypothetical protein NW759_010128 [Fusarium solani]
MISNTMSLVAVLAILAGVQASTCRLTSRSTTWTAPSQTAAEAASSSTSDVYPDVFETSVTVSTTSSYSDLKDTFLTVSTTGSTTTAEPTSSPGVLPRFENEGPAFNKANLQYNPNNEFIFPSVFDASLYFGEAALAKWYLYYAPHDNPGGISFVYSDNLNGPWIEYQSNPVISRDWPALGNPRPGHVSSADAVWNEEEQKMYMYFHGDNSVTRWATSEDGINFDYGGIAVSNSDAPVTTTESSYARVFRHPDPDSEYTWAMFYMVNEPNNIRKIRLAESFNGEDWTVADDYVVSEPGANVSGGNLWDWDGQRYVVYHREPGKIYARTIDKTLRDVGTEAVVLFEASERVAAPYFVTENGTTHMFYELGARSSTSIAYATFGRL